VTWNFALKALIGLLLPIDQVRQMQLNTMYELGWCHYLLLDFEQATSYLNAFLSESKAASFRAYAAYQLGNCFQLMGENDKAISSYRSVHGFVRKHFSYDQFAQRKAKQYIKQGGMNCLQRRLLVASILVEGHYYQTASHILSLIHHHFEDKADEVSQEEAQDEDTELIFERAVNLVNNQLDSQSEVPSQAELSAEYFYLMGRNLRAQGRWDKSQQYFERVVALEKCIKEETYLIPFSLCEIGEMLIESGGPLDEACKMLKAAHTYSHYDFDKPLSRRLMSTLYKCG